VSVTRFKGSEVQRSGVKATGFWLLAACSWQLALKSARSWDARTLGSLKVFNLISFDAFELSSLIAFQPPSNTLTFEP
jgi:hypothetical protein